MSLALVFSSILPFHHFAISSFHHFMCSLRPAVPGVLLLMNAHLWEEGPKSISFQCMYQCFLNHLASCYLVYNLLLWKLKRHCGLLVSALDCTSSSLGLSKWLGSLCCVLGQDSPVFQNTKIFQVKSLYLEPLVSDHLSLATMTTFRTKRLKFSFIFNLP